jgi:hypothetical protein
MGCHARFTVSLALALGACSGEPVTFYNPANGAITECVAIDTDPFLDQCIFTYQKAGWVRLTEPLIIREVPPVATGQ